MPGLLSFARASTVSEADKRIVSRYTSWKERGTDVRSGRGGSGYRVGKSRIYFRDFKGISGRGFLNGTRRKRERKRKGEKEDCYDLLENIRPCARRYRYIGKNPAKSTGIKRRGALKERETREGRFILQLFRSDRVAIIYSRVFREIVID